MIIGNYTRNIDLDIGTTACNHNGTLKFKMPFENAGIYDLEELRQMGYTR